MSTFAEIVSAGPLVNAARLAGLLARSIGVRERDLKNGVVDRILASRNSEVVVQAIGGCRAGAHFAKNCSLRFILEQIREAEKTAKEESLGGQVEGVSGSAGSGQGTDQGQS